MIYDLQFVNMSRIQEFLKAIVDKRKETKGLTQQKLAEQIGATPGMVSALLSGERRFNEDWIEKFCDVLGITLGDIEQATPYVPEPKVLKEYSDKLKQLYETLLDGIIRNSPCTCNCRHREV